MKKHLRILAFILLLGMAWIPSSHADLPTFDAANAFLNQLRNSLMESQFAQNIAVVIDQLNELRTQTLEIFRFHAGLDEILNSVIGEPLGNLLGKGKTGLRDAFLDTGLITPQIEILEGGNGPADIRQALEKVTGQIPEGNQRPYIPFEEMMVVDAFDLARQIREAGGNTRDSANSIAEQAQTASPKGAAKLQAQGVAQLMILGQQNQEAVAKLIELNATQIEQVTRREKEAESERIRYLQDANQFMEDHFASINS
ncbi:MAG TPA: hypothetical protein PLO78_05260 [Candidatus Omnitrophota bacterium]|nr:hypothetical protein [Candidatus Omnitrophota bacterium]